MPAAAIIQHLKITLPTHSIPLVLSALRQDEVVWQSLHETEFLAAFGSHFVEKGAARLENWSPARLALFALQQPDVAIPFTDKLPAALLSQSARSYPDLVQNPEALDLARAGAIALAMYTRSQQNGSWSFLANEVDQHPSFPWGTSLACLVGMVENPLALLFELAARHPSALRSKLAVHALLAHPVETSIRIEYLQAVTQGTQSHFPAQPLEMLDLLHNLNQQNPELAAAFCRKLMAGKPNVSHLPTAQPFHQTDILRETAHTLLNIEICRLAGNQEIENVLLDKLCAMRQILTASLLAQTIPTHPLDPETVLDKSPLQAIWRQAIESLQAVQPEAVLDPFKAGLAQALLQAGRPGEAYALLTNGKQRYADDPYQLLPLILSAKQSGNELLAQQAATQLADIYPNSLQSTNYISPHAIVDPIEIAEQLVTIEMSEAAMRVLESALQKMPNQENWQMKLIDLQLSAGKYAQAAENMQILVGFNPDDLILRHRLARTYEESQNWGAALDEWSSLVEDAHYATSSDALDDLHALASCALNTGRPDQAIHACQRALSLKSDDGLAYTYMGKSYALQHDPVRGLEYATQATQISPTLPQGWLALAELLSQQERHQQAIESLQAAIQIIPNDAGLLFVLGELHLKVGNSTMAVNALKQAVALAPNQNRHHFVLGSALKCLGRVDEALEALGRAYHAEPENIEFAAGYGSALLDNGDRRAALQPLSTAVRDKQAASPLTYVNYARAVLELSQLGEASLPTEAALEAVELALAQDADLPEAKGWHAEALRAMGNLPAAFTAYQTALETRLPNDRSWRERLSFGMGQIAHALGRNDMALASAQEAISAAPHNSENYKLLSAAYMENNLFEDALRSARTVLNLNIDNLTNLAWYSDQITRLVANPEAMLSGNLANQTRQAVLEAQNALLQAVQLAPERSDLLVKLSKLQHKAGDPNSALETIRLVKDNINANAEQLSAAAEQMKLLGDLSGAIDCLEKAVARDQSNAQPASPELLAHLSKAYLDKGDLISASAALEQAISTAPDMGSLYYERTNLLISLGHTEDAFCCVETGISLARTDPSLPQLYLLAAWLYRLNGDLASALGYIQKGLDVYQQLAAANPGSQPVLPLSERILAADIYRAALQPHKAYKLLKAEPDELNSNKTSADYRYPWACLMTELELILGYAPDLQYFDQPQSEINPLTAGWLAVQARLGLRAGNSEQANKAYHSAIRMAQEENATQGNMSGPGRVTFRQAMTSLLEAALEMNDWAYAQEVVSQLSEIAPNEPYTHLAVVRFTVALAEFQLACKRLGVQQHAPGETALSLDKKTALEEANQQASTLVHMLEKNNPKYDLVYPITSLEHWHARGEIAFICSDPAHVDQTQLSAAIARLKHYAPSHPQSADEAVAVISGSSLLWSQDAEHNLLAEILQITRPHSRNAWVWFNAALALERQYPREAFGAVRGAIQLLPTKQTALAALNQALLGRIAQHINDLTIASEAIEAALAIWPDEAAWHELAAQIYQASHRPTEGLKHLQQAAKLIPTSLSVQLELGKAYLADSKQGNGAIAHAIQCFDSAVHLNPGEIAAWIWLAQAQLRGRQVEAASKSVEQILKMSPDNREAAMLQAEIALQKKAYQAAHAFAQSAVRASPEDPKTTLLLAKTLRSLNQPTEALQVLESALPISQDPLELQYERAKLLHELHGPEAALNVLTELVANYPDDANILTSLARSQADLGDIQAATQTALAALKVGKINLEPSELANIHYLTGTLLRRSGQLDQAIQQLNEAVTLAPDNLEGYLELGLARKERREYQLALQAFEQATRIAPHDPRPHYQAGLTLKEGKDYRRSEVMLRQAAHLAPDDVLVRRQLAQVVALNVVHNPRS